MEDRIRVNVKIFGVDYVLSGDSKREEILNIASYVDGKMQEISDKAIGASLSQIAVLTSINTAEDLFKLKESYTDLEQENQRLTKDTMHYVKLWDEAKNSFMQYKEDANSSVEQVEEMRNKLEEKNIEMQGALRRQEEMQADFDELSEKYNEILSQTRLTKDSNESATQEIIDLAEKCKEMENSFFDLQMENIQLKGELDRYKKIVD
jgi:cell division protein ZapA